MPIRWARRRLLPMLSLAVALCWVSFAAEAAKETVRVTSSVAERAAREEPVDVLVLLDDALERRQLLGALGAEARRQRLGRAEHEQFVGTQRALMGALKSDVMLAAADPDLQVLTDYDLLPVLHLRIRSARALDNLRRQARVRSIEAIRFVRPALAESLPLINQPAVQALGHTGEGTTVAVLDTGVDYTRAAFGSCSAPGGGCKVAVAQDFATPDGALDTGNFHGTNVAGIVLGVAPGARVAALDVFESNGQASSNVILSAINWCIANRATYNIVAINMSLGGGRYYAPIAPTDSVGVAIANAVSAGIAVVVASGNNGYTDSIAWPAAYSNVVSVGAFYDAGGSVNQVTSFSNSASFLTMVAPGSMIQAAGISMQGTSQATPHVAGAVAVLKAAYPNDTVAQIVDKLKLGAALTDGRNGIAKPRLDLQAAMSIPPATYRLTVTKSGAGAGTVVSSPSAIDCGSTCVSDVTNGDTVTLTALHGAGSTFGGWTGACSGSAGSCTVTMSAARSVTATFHARTSEDLLVGGALPPGWTQPAGTDAAWAPTTGSLYVGTHALKAATVGHGQQAAIRISGQFATGTVSFARRVSSESGGDFLRFYIDDQLQGSWSGEVPWGMVSFPISAGSRTLTWVYQKNGANSAGSDTAWIDSVHLPYAAANRKMAHVDFDGDGRADILWRHAGKGGNALWLMNGPVRQDGSGATATVGDLAWQVVGTGDFDGDGKADILWRHSGNGQNALWTMDGIARRSSTVLATVGDLGWRVVGVGDFDADGKADILWRHASNGQNAIWLMDGAVRRSATVVSAVTDTRWAVVGVDDVDGDGKADILWRHAGTGQNALWLMSGTTRLGSFTLPSIADLGWRVPGVGDLDGDGKADIVWRHAGNGQNAVWLMDGATRRASTLINSIADLGWAIAGVADFDADGKADILWRHSGNGGNALWTMNGSTRLGAHLMEGLSDLGWRIVSP